MSDLTNQLAALPPKVRQPLEGLHNLSLIAPDDLKSILTAGRLAKSNQTLLGFAVAFLHLKYSGVSVKDTVAMADQLKLPVNLSWSANKWREKHALFSRAVTLKRLADESIQYDVSAFASTLPAQWPGYLIRSSRRLGMEDLRQRHCVASYDHRLRQSNCAIAVVFVDRVRWTVELRFTNDGRPVITQIKSRLNQSATAEVRECIHDMLDVEEQAFTPMVGRNQHDIHLTYDAVRNLLPLLRENAVDNVYINFDGGGDEGHIHYVGFSPGERDLSQVHVELERERSDYVNGEWQTRTLVEQVCIEDAIADYVYKMLEDTDIDWYNNDGGYGSVTIDVNEATAELVVNVNYTESNRELWHTVNLVDGTILDG